MYNFLILEYYYNIIFKMQSPLIHRTQIVAIEETAKNINS